MLHGAGSITIKSAFQIKLLITETTRSINTHDACGVLTPPWDKYCAVPSPHVTGEERAQPWVSEVGQDPLLTPNLYQCLHSPDAFGLLVEGVIEERIN